MPSSPPGGSGAWARVVARPVTKCAPRSSISPNGRLDVGARGIPAAQERYSPGTQNYVSCAGRGDAGGLGLRRSCQLLSARDGLDAPGAHGAPDLVHYSISSEGSAQCRHRARTGCTGAFFMRETERADMSPRRRRHVTTVVSVPRLRMQAPPWAVTPTHLGIIIRRRSPLRLEWCS